MSYSKKILLNGLGHVCEFTILYCRLLVEALALNLKGQFFFIPTLSLCEQYARAGRHFIHGKYLSKFVVALL